jgi:hypothetical protein
MMMMMMMMMTRIMQPEIDSPCRRNQRCPKMRIDNPSVQRIARSKKWLGTGILCSGIACTGARQPDHALTLSSLSAPRATIFGASSGNGRYGRPAPL